MEIRIIQGDITQTEVDIIVNAANSSLMGGSGVDGAIHKAGGPQILNDCIAIRNKQGSCKTGAAVITRAGLLPAKYVIHTVGPVWNGGNKQEETLLRSCYVNCIFLAKQYEAKSIAFPNISTGIYGFPKDKAATIAIDVITQTGWEGTVIFVCFDAENYAIYKAIADGA